jgi:hypothetical protein
VIVPERYVSAFVGECVQLRFGVPRRRVNNSALWEGLAEMIEDWLDQDVVLDHARFSLDGFGNLTQAPAHVRS